MRATRPSLPVGEPHIVQQQHMQRTLADMGDETRGDEGARNENAPGNESRPGKDFAV